MFFLIFIIILGIVFVEVINDVVYKDKRGYITVDKTKKTYIEALINWRTWVLWLSLFLIGILVNIFWGTMLKKMYYNAGIKIPYIIEADYIYYIIIAILYLVIVMILMKKDKILRIHIYFFIFKYIIITGLIFYVLKIRPMYNLISDIAG